MITDGAKRNNKMRLNLASRRE